MIDSHCHLEQKDFEKDRDYVIERCKEELKGVVSCATNLSEFEILMEIISKHKGFVFGCAGIHPEYVKSLSDKDLELVFEKIKANKDRLVGIGEVGLDYYWIKEENWRKKQKEMFVEFINFSKEMDMPLVVHSRDAYEDALKMLEQFDVKKCLLHLFGGENLIQRVIENSFYISFGPILLVSKKHQKMVEKMPLDLILVETDSPWNSPSIFLEKKRERNIPLNIKIVAKKISEIKKLSFAKVWEKLGENASKLFNLKFNTEYL